jgi:transposase-like protein
VGFPVSQCAKLLSANPIEPLNGETKRRTEVGGICTNEAALLGNSTTGWLHDARNDRACQQQWHCLAANCCVLNNLALAGNSVAN